MYNDSGIIIFIYYNINLKITAIVILFFAYHNLAIFVITFEYIIKLFLTNNIFTNSLFC